MTLLQELEQKAGQLSEDQRAAFALKLLATLPPILEDDDDGIAEAEQRDAEMDADPSSGISDQEFRSAVAAARRR